MALNKSVNDPEMFVSGFGIGISEGMMPTKKIFLDDGYQAVMSCSNCFQARTVSGSDYAAVEGMVRIRLKCACGNSDSVVLERRRSFRKTVDLPGVVNPDRESSEKPMIIENLSVSGMRIRLSEGHGARIGDKLTVVFKAGPGANHSVRKEVVVRRIEEDAIGVEFCDGFEDPESQTIHSLIFTSN